MKKAILFTLFSLLFVQFGCESYHHEDIQEQQERQKLNEASPDVRPRPVSEHEGGNSGSK